MIFMDEIKTVLWRIGKSVVATIPSNIVKKNKINVGGKKVFFVSIRFSPDVKFEFVGSPWKCGGSFVMTIPYSYMKVYNYNSFIARRKEVVLGLISADNVVSG